MTSSKENGCKVYNMDQIRQYTMEDIAKETVKKFRNQSLCTGGIDFVQNLLLQIALNPAALESLVCKEINGVVPIHDIADFMREICQVTKLKNEKKLTRKEQKMVMAASMAAALVTRRLMTNSLALKRALEEDPGPPQAPDQVNATKRVCGNEPDDLQIPEELTIAATSSIDNEISTVDENYPSTMQVETLVDEKALEMTITHQMQVTMATDLNTTPERHEVEKLLITERTILELVEKSSHTIENPGEYYQCVFEGKDQNKCGIKYKYLNQMEDHLRTQHFEAKENMEPDEDYHACIKCNRLFLTDIIQEHRHLCHSMKSKCKNLQHDVENADMEKLLHINVDNVKQSTTIVTTEKEPEQMKSSKASNAGDTEDDKNDFADEENSDEKLQNLENDGEDANLHITESEPKENAKQVVIEGCQQNKQEEHLQEESEKLDVFEIESKEDVKNALLEQLQNCKEAKEFLQTLVDSGGLKNFLESFQK